MNGALSGPNNGRAKLTWEIVHQDREYYHRYRKRTAKRFVIFGDSLKNLARERRVAVSTYRDMLIGKTWRQ